RRAQLGFAQGVAESRKRLLPREQRRGGNAEERGGKGVPLPREHPREPDDEKRRRRRDFRALTGADGLDVQQHDQNAEQSEREHRVLVTEQSARRADERGEGEGAKARFLATVLSLDPDE